MASDKVLSPKERFAILDKITELPSLPQVLVGISRVASDPKSSTNALADIILHDQALTLRILRIANSAQYAMYAQRISTVSKAVVLLGFQSVRAIALGAETYRLLSTLSKAEDVLERFWKDAISVAVVSQELGIMMNLDTVEEAFVAGLLHDAGKLIFAQYDPDGARQIYQRGLTEREVMLEETRVFGVNHAEMGGEIARRWELPQEIRWAMEHHHHLFPRPPASGGELLAFIVSVSKAIVDPKYGDERMRRDLASNMARILVKPVGQVLELLQRLPEQIQSYAEFFDIQVDDLKVYTMWVEQENVRLTHTVREQEEGRRDTERSDAFLAGIRELHSLLLRQKGTAAVADKIAQTLFGVVGAHRVIVCAIDQNRRAAEGLWSAGSVDKPFAQQFQELLFSDGLLAQVVRDSSPLNVLDRNIPYFNNLLNGREKVLIDAPCFVVLPVVLNRRVVGLLYADRQNDGEAFSDEDVGDMQTLADIF